MFKTFMPSKKVQKPTRSEKQKASRRSTWLCTCGVGPSTPPNVIKMKNDQRPEKKQNNVEFENEQG
jgi:hypothetical protein